MTKREKLLRMAAPDEEEKARIAAEAERAAARIKAEPVHAAHATAFDMRGQQLKVLPRQHAQKM